MTFATNKAALQFGGYWNIGNSQEAGVKVTKSDGIFPDYDIMKDYVQKKK